MKTLLRIFLIVLLLSSFSTVAYSQKALYDELNQEMAALFKKGQYDDAIKIAEEALEVAEKTFGKKHPYTSVSLNNLAMLHTARGDYAKAESIYEQSLKIAEDILGKNHPQLISILENMAKCCDEMGEYDKAATLEERVENIRASNS